MSLQTPDACTPGNSPRQIILSTKLAAVVLVSLALTACGGGSGSGSGSNSTSSSDSGSSSGSGNTIDGGGSSTANTDSSGTDIRGSDTAAEVYQIALEDYEQNLIDRGTQLGEKFLSTSLSELNSQPRSWYYDSQRAFFQAADYLGDPNGSWAEYAQAAETAYEAYVQPDYEMPGYERFPHGLKMDYLRTGESNSYTTLRNLRDNGPFSNVLTWSGSDNWYKQRFSREVAYMIETHVMAERAGMPRQTEALEAYVDRALTHIEVWTSGDYIADDPDWQFCQSFMTGLTASALISYYELTVHKGKPDARIPEAIRTLGDWLVANMWVPNHEVDGYYDYEPEVYGSFRYVVPAVDGVGGTDPAPDLNLLIAPLFGWLYQHTGDLRYRTVGDKAFAGGVAFAYLVPDKAFNQNYRTSFDYIEWREEGNTRWGN